MHASIATPWLAANHHTGNGQNHLRIGAFHNAHTIFPSSCSSLYSLSRVIQHVDYTQVQVQNFEMALQNLDSIHFYWTQRIDTSGGERVGGTSLSSSGNAISVANMVSHDKHYVIVIEAFLENVTLSWQFRSYFIRNISMLT